MSVTVSFGSVLSVKRHSVQKFGEEEHTKHKRDLFYGLAFNCNLSQTQTTHPMIFHLEWESLCWKEMMWNLDSVCNPTSLHINGELYACTLTSSLSWSASRPFFHLDKWAKKAAKIKSDNQVIMCYFKILCSLYNLWLDGVHFKNTHNRWQACMLCS